jgi:predicted SAM-dependent methyltransferase
MSIVRAHDGSINLHLWREGIEYLTQKGSIFLKEWNNVVLSPVARAAMENTLCLDVSREPLPFPNCTFDAIYANHVFEHLSPAEGRHLIGELSRVAKPGSVIRLSTPDLEQLAQEYLACLGHACAEPTGPNVVRYRWAAMALFDQMVREKSGGGMAEAIARREFDEEQMVRLFGDGLKPLISGVPTWPGENLQNAGERTGNGTVRESLNALVSRLKKVVLPHQARFSKGPGPTDVRATREAVRWMHDRLSLKLLLEAAGFVGVEWVTYTESQITGWSRYQLDRSNNGAYPLDPSVYVEARKPAE